MLETMSFGESLLTSLTGLAVVFTVLIVLALATIAIAHRALDAGRHVGDIPKGGRLLQTVDPKAGAAEEELGDIVAALQGALSMESGIPVDKLVIKSIKSVPGASDKQQ